MTEDNLVQINKFLAQCGIASRRKADILIKEGRVRINDTYAKAGDKVNTKKDSVYVNNKLVKLDEEDFEYILLNKPVGVLSTVEDDRGRTTVLDFIDSKKRLVPVGRLDFNSTGLMLLTNDGDLTYKMTHPKYHIPKKYHVEVLEIISKKQLEPIINGGIIIEDKVTSPAEIKLLGDQSFEITLYEGIKRQVRLSCNAVGLTVRSLKRISIGMLKLGNLEEGKFRHATTEELNYFDTLKQQ